MLTLIRVLRALRVLRVLRALVVATLAATSSARSAAAADLPTLIAASKTSVLPVGSYDPSGNPRFEFRGSGFVVGNGNLVATNFHVLPAAGERDQPAQLVVLVARSAAAEPSVRLARVVATDRLRDLVLLQFEGAALAPLPLAAAGSIREGQAVALMGFPIGSALGYSVVTHHGIVASITSAALPAPTARQLDPRAVARLREGNFEVLQLDATAYPGNSGGPVLNADSGEVVGVVNQVLVKSSRESALSSPTGITYAIPVALLHELLQQLAHGQPAAALPQQR